MKKDGNFVGSLLGCVDLRIPLLVPAATQAAHVNSFARGEGRTSKTGFWGMDLWSVTSQELRLPLKLWEASSS